MRILTRALLVAVLALPLLFLRIEAQDTGWIISNFRSDIAIAKEGRVEVEETILVDFNGLSKHGIFRTIPVDYRDRFGNKLNIRLNVISVTDDSGATWRYETKRRGRNIEIKIGDPDKLVTGRNVYTIRYSVYRVITRFKDHDEFYWNATGSDWPVPIQAAEARVRLPGDVTRATCYSGRYGTSLEDCNYTVQGSVATFAADRPLTSGEELTIVVATDKGVISEIPLLTQTLWFVEDNWLYAVPLFTLAVLLWLYWLNGRDQRYKSLFDPTKGTERLPLFAAELAPSTYAPLEDLRPAEAGTLIDEEVNIRDIAATMIDLAVRGYLEIEEVEKGKIRKRTDYRLFWKNKNLEGLEDFEQVLLTEMFKKSKADDSILLSDLKYKFTESLKKTRDSLYNRMKEKAYFPQRPDKVVTMYRVIGALVAIAGFFTIGVSIAWTVASVSSGALIFLFAKLMPRKNAFGRKHYLRVLGLRNFVALGAYREQLWERANIFEEVLPYAIAFDLTHKWAEAFERISVPPPSWYRGTTPFSAQNFAYNMESFTRTTSKTLPATKSSAASGGSGFGGGGFSGGGFGGGGGGSW